MNNRNFLLPLLVIGCIVFFYFSFNAIPPPSHNLKIGSWNLQIFGVKKASNMTLLTDYATKIKGYDIFFIQEIRDESDTSFESLCNLLRDYNCVESSRAGRSDSKEQYGLIYKKGLDLVNTTDYNINPNLSTVWERPPFEATFLLNNQSLNLYTIHTRPANAKNEISALETLNLNNSVIIGDLNADCTYFTQGSELSNFDWLIQSGQDTTVGVSNCAYDRIIVNPNIESHVTDHGIDNTITPDLSDHYLIWFNYSY